jgi:hypothetical protein
MYNKLFTKILDSSVWLESTTTRIVWLTMIASMDEDGFAAFAAMGNLANRARVSIPQCEQAVKVLERPDSESADPEFAGRRIERVPGGWIVLNAAKYRELVTRIVARENTRLRVQRYRAHKREETSEIACNAPCNAHVTPSEAEAEAEVQKIKSVRAPAQKAGTVPADFEELWATYPNHRGKQAALRAWTKLAPDADLVGVMCIALAWQARQVQWVQDGGRFVPMFATWLNGRRFEDEEPAGLAGVDRPVEPVGAWRDQCLALHAGRCGNAHFHAAKMQEEAGS